MKKLQQINYLHYEEEKQQSIIVIDCYCLSCIHSFRTENKLTFHENVSKIKDSCGCI